MRLLVVEDDPANADLYRILFKQIGQVRVVENGTDALEACRQSVPDLILMDANLPGEMDGFELTRRLRASKATRQVPIVFVTGREEAWATDAAYEAGANAVYHKPFSPRLLATEVIRLALPREGSDLTPMKAALMDLDDAYAARDFLTEKLKAGAISDGEFRELAEWATGFFLRLRLADPAASSLAS